ncbi:hypothetical protein [Bergeriella denitrificans]|uniref:Uncharacterized protein n=1 Tax=Bergeriella denitrificans TaxID=494 RepID=A0A378ULS4_BERDE|nr:hypothetical protein [Bergeriella denitrificans]STZ77451.1 Uncharacterised protein [Bergeriella denitrificans]
MSGNKILLCMPSYSGIVQTFENNLRHHGFDVATIAADGSHFQYPSIAVQITTKFRQIVLRQKNAKEHLKSKILTDRLQQLLSEQTFDYALFIRADMFPLSMLQTIKQQNIPLIGYQWDGMNRYPDIWSYHPFFDKFYAFDSKDVHHGPGLSPSTNFYFDHLSRHTAAPQTDLYFIGAHQPEREHSLKLFVQYAEVHGFSLDCHLSTLNENIRAYHDCPAVQTSKTGFDYAENLARIQNARAIVDFKTPAHNGLSFRAFEALGYRKKLITTNAEIKKYDFYHPDNIFVWDGQHLDGLAEFMARPLHEFPAELYAKYSFGNWIRYILDIAPHQKISLPE